MPDKKLITVVCTANVCRSPMGEKLLQHAINAEESPLKDIKVISAGVSAFGGDKASLNSVKVLEPVGLDLSNHSSQSLTQEMIDASFAVLCMTQSHLMLAEYHFKNPGNLYLFRDFMETTSEREIPDPFGQDLPAYEVCRDSMVEAIPSIIQFLRKEYR